MSAQRQTTGGKQDVQKTERQKGLHLVELIVVLVILAILAALLIPALTGYIDKANAEKAVAETRMVVMAIQTESSSTYAKGELKNNSANKTDGNLPSTTNIDKLAEVKGLQTSAFYKAEVSSTGTVLAVQYENGTYICVYKDGAYTVNNKKGNGTALAESTVTVPDNNTATINALSNSIV